MKQTSSFGQFIRFVPAANHILNGGIEGSLSQTNKEADCNETIESVRSGENHGERTPNQFHGGDPQRWTDSRDEETTIACERGAGDKLSK